MLGCGHSLKWLNEIKSDQCEKFIFFCNEMRKQQANNANGSKQLSYGALEHIVTIFCKIVATHAYLVEQGSNNRKKSFLGWLQNIWHCNQSGCLKSLKKLQQSGQPFFGEPTEYNHCLGKLNKLLLTTPTGFANFKLAADCFISFLRINCNNTNLQKKL